MDCIELNENPSEKIELLIELGAVSEETQGGLYIGFEQEGGCGLYWS